MRRSLLVVLAFAAVTALGVWLTNTSWFVQREAADEAAFVATVGGVLVTDESRAIIAESVVDRAVAEVPILALLAGPLRSFVAAVLTAPVMEPAVAFIAEQMYDVVVQGALDPVLLDLAAATEALLEAITEVAPELAALIPQSAFGIVELVAEGDLPSFAGVVDASAWLMWIAPVLAAVGAALTLVRAPSTAVGLMAVGLAVMAGAVLSLAGIPVGRSAALGEIGATEILGVAEQAFDVFVRRFLVQTFWVLAAGAVVAIAGTVWYAVSGARTAPAGEA